MNAKSLARVGPGGDRHGTEEAGSRCSKPAVTEGQVLVGSGVWRPVGKEGANGRGGLGLGKSQVSATRQP